MGFEVFTEVDVYSVTFCVVTPCIQLWIFQRNLLLLSSGSKWHDLYFKE